MEHLYRVLSDNRTELIEAVKSGSFTTMKGYT
jgi:hypothetical protein